MFISKLSITSDLKQVRQDLDQILSITDWGERNQIGLNHRPDAQNTWHDGAGSLWRDYDHQSRPREHDFSVWNQHLPEYLKSQLLSLKQELGCEFGRVRFMRLLPKTGLSVHADAEKRLHLVIQTNPHAFVGQIQNGRRIDSDVPATGSTYHLPCDGYWYEVDTRKSHYVYNGGFKDRIHLVVCRLD